MPKKGLVNKTLDPGIYPFWFWNGDQTEVEIDRQLRIAQDGRFKGMAIHSRTGNRIPYLSDRWFELVRHACRTAHQLGLKIWIYDEDGFPSGTVGTRIQAENPELRQQYLHFRYLHASVLDRVPLACFDTVNYRRLDPRQLPKDTDILVFFLHRLDRYVDTLNPRTAKLFIQYTHERYYEELAEFFGTTVECIYTDDIDSKMVVVSGLPWTDGLDATFLERYGEPLIDNLPLLVEELPGCETMRIKFRELIQNLFLENFVQPTSAWCFDHNVVYTGHLSGDEGPLTRTINETGAVMPFHRHEHIPGIDDYLSIMDDCRYLKHAVNKHGVSALPLFKSGASVAHQQGHGLFSCECLAGTGWDFTMAQQDRQMLFEIAMGVNLLTPHAAYYTVGGPGKKDFPPSYFFQQPYWPLWQIMAEKWTRSATLLRRGTFQADTLLIYPSRSAWARHTGQDIISDFATRCAANEFSVSSLELATNQVMRELLRLKVGFDLADETESVARGKVVGKGLQLGSMIYHTVIIPTKIISYGNWDAWLSELSNAEVRVIRLDEVSDENREELLRQNLKPDIVLTSPDGDDLSEILVHGRVVHGQREFFLLNLSGIDKTLSTNPSYDFRLYDPEADIEISHAGTFVLPAWNGCHLLLPDCQTGNRSHNLKTTRFACRARQPKTPLTLDRVVTEQMNTAVLKSLSELCGRYEFEVTSNVLLETIITENKLDHVSIDGYSVPLSREISHSCDPCYYGRSLEIRLNPGRHRLEIENPSGMLQIGGVFSAFYLSGSVTLSEPNRALRLGDLSQQGLAFYHGAVCYAFTIKATSKTNPDLWLDLGKTIGAVKLHVNGKPITCLYHPPYVSLIGPYLHIGDNQIMAFLYNTAQNFIDPFQNGECTPARFGIFGPITISTERL